MHAPTGRSLPRWRWTLPRLAVGAGALALVVWEGEQSRYSADARWSVIAVIVVGLLLALVAGRGRQKARSRAWARHAISGVRGVFTGRGRAPLPAVIGSVVWLLLIAAVIGWDLNSFLHQNHALPTLSRLFGDVTDHEWGRSLVFAGWLALGTCVATGWRRPLGESRVVPLTDTRRRARRAGPGEAPRR